MDWQRLRRVSGLGMAQVLAWASSYYLVAILADPIARDLNTSPTMVFTAFSAALLLAALLGPHIGRTIDRLGGREVLALSNLLFAAGLFLLSIALDSVLLWVAWFLIGTAMGLGLYDAAFASLGRIYGTSARSAITGITLIAGFASTVGWPLTAWGLDSVGWRATCVGWGIAHLGLGLPLHILLLPKRSKPADGSALRSAPRLAMDRAMWLLGFAFAAGWVVSTAMAAHLPRILEDAGATAPEAIAAAALVGPAQVGARMLEAGVLSRYHPLISARLSTIAHPIGAGLLLAGGGWLVMPFTVFHGAGNGILTIAQGTVPLAIFGSENYGYRLGVLGAPARIVQAGAPLAFSALIEVFGAYALVFSALICLAGCAALMAVRTTGRHSSGSNQS